VENMGAASFMYTLQSKKVRQSCHVGRSDNIDVLIHVIGLSKHE
jgi:hypothetical protein